MRTLRHGVLRLSLGAAALLAVAVPIAWATDVFSDVPTGSPHHDNINTIARAGVTVGCAPGLYCPAGSVRRDEMATFLKRTLQALTPAFVQQTSAGGSVDIDTSPVLCQTSGFTPTVAARARIDSWLSLEPAVTGPPAMSFSAKNVYSTNGGTTWTDLDPTGVAPAGNDSTGEWAHTNNTAILTLAAGTTYVFGVQTGRLGTGTIDAGSHQCEVIAEVTYADAGPPTVG